MDKWEKEIIFYQSDTNRNPKPKSPGCEVWYATSQKHGVPFLSLFYLYNKQTNEQIQTCGFYGLPLHCYILVGSWIFWREAQAMILLVY